MGPGRSGVGDGTGGGVGIGPAIRPFWRRVCIAGGFLVPSRIRKGVGVGAVVLGAVELTAVLCRSTVEIFVETGVEVETAVVDTVCSGQRLKTVIGSPHCRDSKWRTYAAQ